MQHYKLVFKGKSEGDDAFFFRFYLQFSHRDRWRFWSLGMYVYITFRTFGYYSYCLIQSHKAVIILRWLYELVKNSLV